LHTTTFHTRTLITNAAPLTRHNSHADLSLPERRSELAARLDFDQINRAVESPPGPSESTLPSTPPVPRGSATSAITLLAFAAFASQSMVRVSDSLLPQISADFGVSVGAASIVVTAYALAHGSVQLIAGPVGDRFGKYACVTVAAAISTVLVLLCGLAGSLPALVAARLACGLSAGWIIPLAMAFLGDVIPYERRQQVLGTFLSGQILGQLFGQAAGGVLGDLFGWRRVFFFLAALFAIATVALLVEFIRNPITHASHASATRSRGFITDYATVLRSPWARQIIAMGFIESAFMFGAFAYVGADLHLRFGVSFAVVGLFVGAFAIGGLIYSLSVRGLVNRLGQIGLATRGGIMLALAYVTIAFTPRVSLAPFAITAIGLGFYMLHNTLQTNATQMSPEARGTAVAIFSSTLYLGQTLGVAINGIIFDRFTAVPVFVIAATGLLALGLWFARELRRHAKSA
jgi:YNFM family putative membrane transporter